MDNQYLKELTQKYVDVDKEYREYRNQFFALFMKKKGKTPKMLTREELSKLQAMRDNVEEIHQEWLKLIRGEK